jgi:serine/threonine protein phosphatase 1
MPGLTYAIGDIHGRLDLLQAAVKAIAAHAHGRIHQVICLGDYVDRGPASKGVVEVLMTLVANARWRCLLGNHEDMMAQSLRSRDRDALNNGGDATLDSYFDEIPLSHLEWLEALPLIHRDVHRLYVHAGVAPGAPVELQDKRTLIWIREAFLTAGANALPCHVVHGHTPHWRMKPEPRLPERLAHRTNLDTGAYFTGILSIGVFDDVIPGGPLEILSITGPEALQAQPVT